MMINSTCVWIAFGAFGALMVLGAVLGALSYGTRLKITLSKPVTQRCPVCGAPAGKHV